MIRGNIKSFVFKENFVEFVLYDLTTKSFIKIKLIRINALPMNYFLSQIIYFIIPNKSFDYLNLPHYDSKFIYIKNFNTTLYFRTRHSNRRYFKIHKNLIRNMDKQYSVFGTHFQSVSDRNNGRLRWQMSLSLVKTRQTATACSRFTGYLTQAILLRA